MLRRGFPRGELLLLLVAGAAVALCIMDAVVYFATSIVRDGGDVAPMLVMAFFAGFCVRSMVEICRLIVDGIMYRWRADAKHADVDELARRTSWHWDDPARRGDYRLQVQNTRGINPRPGTAHEQICRAGELVEQGVPVLDAINRVRRE